MADRKPRIRKSAPTIRERADAERAKVENTKPSKASRAISKSKKVTGKVRLPSNAVTRKISSFFRLIGRGLRWLVPSYFVNSWRTVKQVTWPNRKETWRLTSAVFAFAIIFGALVAGVDKVLDEVFKKLILK